MVHESLWLDRERPYYPPRKPPKHIDVVVVGAGITGLTAAWMLKRAGKRVGVFDRGRIAAAETGHTSAHLTCVTDTPLTGLARTFGRDGARLAWSAGVAAIDVIERTIEDHDIACQFQRVPNHVVSSLRSHDDQELDCLREEAELARDLGFEATLLEAGPLGGRPAVRYARQAMMDPAQYVTALASIVNGDGSIVCEDSPIVRVIDDPLAVIVNGEFVETDYLIVATHVPLMGAASAVSSTLFQTKIAAYSTYVVGARLPNGSLPLGLYSDTSDPYYYLRVHHDAEGAYAIFGGEDHKTGRVRDTEACYTRLQQALEKLFPESRIDRRWSGQVIETHDGLPYIGETADRQFVATGFAGNGLTFGTFAGIMAHDAAMGRSNAWQELFAPRRKHLIASNGTFLRANIDYPYYFLRDRLRRRSDDAALEQVACGDGKVLSIGGKRVACYRTDNGEIIALDAKCTHLGCLVRWNTGEQTWDCPCHGSRFATDGGVISGPAEEPLERVELEHEGNAASAAYDAT